jgi:hypothetical protein
MSRLRPSLSRSPEPLHWFARGMPQPMNGEPDSRILVDLRRLDLAAIPRD